MICAHIKAAKAIIFDLINSLADKHDKTIYDNIGEWVTVDEIKEVEKHFSEKKKFNTEFTKTTLSKAFEKIVSKATDKYIIDQAALNRHLGDIYKLLDQCDCCNELEMALKVRTEEIKGLVGNLEFAKNVLEEEKKTGAELIKSRMSVMNLNPTDKYLEKRKWSDDYSRGQQLVISKKIWPQEVKNEEWNLEIDSELLSKGTIQGSKLNVKKSITEIAAHAKGILKNIYQMVDKEMLIDLQEELENEVKDSSESVIKEKKNGEKEEKFMSRIKSLIDQKEYELEDSLNNIKNKIDEDSKFLLEMLLETQSKVSVPGNDAFAQEQLKSLKSSLREELNSEEIESVCWKQKVVVQLKEIVKTLSERPLLSQERETETNIIQVDSWQMK